MVDCPGKNIEHINSRVESCCYHCSPGFILILLQVATMRLERIPNSSQGGAALSVCVSNNPPRGKQYSRGKFRYKFTRYSPHQYYCSFPIRNLRCLIHRQAAKNSNNSIGISPVPRSNCLNFGSESMWQPGRMFAIRRSSNAK